MTGVTAGARTIGQEKEKSTTENVPSYINMKPYRHAYIIVIITDAHVEVCLFKREKNDSCQLNYKSIVCMCI